jgi:hypothetical protein
MFSAFSEDFGVLINILAPCVFALFLLPGTVVADILKTTVKESLC